MHWTGGQKVKVTRLRKPWRLLVMHAATAVCCCCLHGSACWYDCLCFLVSFSFGWFIWLRTCSSVLNCFVLFSICNNDYYQSRLDGENAVTAWSEVSNSTLWAICLLVATYARLMSQSWTSVLWPLCCASYVGNTPS